MKPDSIRLLAVTTVPDGKAAVQNILGELEDLFGSESQEFELVGLAYNKQAAMQQLNQIQPDVFLVDLTLPGLRSIDIISAASAALPDVKILALAPSDPPHDRVILALQAGALGYVLMDAKSKEIFAALKKTLAGENYLPVAETFEVLRQAAPELLISAKERRANLIDSLLALIPLVGILSALAAFLWRRYWGLAGIRVSDLGVDASARVTDLLMAMILLLGILGPIFFIRTWLKGIGDWIGNRPKLNAGLKNFRNSKFARSPVGNVIFGDFAAWLVVCALILSGSVILLVADLHLVNFLIGIVVLVVVLVHIARSSDFLPDWLTLTTDRIRESVIIIACLVTTLVVVLTVEVNQGPDLRTDGVHGFIAPKVLGLSARPAMFYDLEEKRAPISALYIGGNADLYVLYDPCEKVARLIPVGSSRVRMIDEVKC
jgi:DNA-binding NarL/FixJ family response regulator